MIELQTQFKILFQKIQEENSKIYERIHKIEDSIRLLNHKTLELRIINKRCWNGMKLMVEGVQKSYNNVLDMTKTAHSDQEERLQDLANGISSASPWV